MARPITTINPNTNGRLCQEVCTTILTGWPELNRCICLLLLAFAEPVISADFIKFVFLNVRTIASPCGVFSLSLSRCFRLRLVGNLTVRVN
jgi:hypothetical protein